ncbi:MAG: hypothetical protein KatS3mg132_621 [Limisphaera sp.]|nr:MAG: hypothetical protein KatS3mg132_621 [Limisphaera sp.]
MSAQSVLGHIRRAFKGALAGFCFGTALGLSPHPAARAQNLDVPPGVETVGAVMAMTRQSDGSIVVGGDFWLVGGQPRSGMARFAPNGALDLSFAPSADGAVRCLIALPDDRILIGGSFQAINGQPRSGLARLLPDGSLDPSFSVNVAGQVWGMAMEPDGSVVIAGLFTNVAGLTRQGMARVRPDGTVDPFFRPPAGPFPMTVGIQRDGNLLVGGQLYEVGGLWVTNLARVFPSGSVDASFTPIVNDYWGQPTVRTVLPQPDGRILFGGWFDWVQGQSRSGLARVYASGQIDLGFSSSVTNPVRSIALQADGRIWVGGEQTGVARLMPDGSRDATMPEIVGGSGTVLVLPGGQCLVFYNTVASYVRRLTVPGPSGSSLTYTSGAWRWQASGAHPQPQYVVFESTTNGVNWTSLGTPSYTGSYWFVGAPAPSTGQVVRARAYVSGGIGNSSGYWLRDEWGPPLVVVTPADMAPRFGDSISLMTSVSGSRPVQIQWFKDGQPLNDDGRVSGAQSPVLRIQSVTGTDSGTYSLVASNAMGVVTSTVANVKVSDPVIVILTADRWVRPGLTSRLRVEAMGSTPLSYQWFKDGNPLGSATNQQLQLNDPRSEDAGAYWVVVSNRWGSATSEVAVLRWNLAVPAIAAQQPYQPMTGTVRALAVDRDGFLYAAGDLSYQHLGVTYASVVRFQPDGRLDESFRSPLSGLAQAIALRKDGGLWVGGQVSLTGGSGSGYLVRLGPDGGLDPQNQVSVNGSVTHLLPVPDGGLLVAGIFSQVNGSSIPYLARLTAGGQPDTSFRSYALAAPRALAWWNGEIAAFGRFTNVTSGGVWDGLVRLQSNGVPRELVTTAVGGIVRALVVGTDGSLWVGGQQLTLNGQPRGAVLRLRADGSEHPAGPPLMDGVVWTIVPMPDGSVWVAGQFDAVGQSQQPGVVRLRPDGWPDPDFTVTFHASDAARTVYAWAAGPDGSIYLGGDFRLEDPIWSGTWTWRRVLARFQAPHAVNQRVDWQQDRIIWRIEGWLPEPLWARLDFSPDGTQWTPGPSGVRSPEGWMWTNPPDRSYTVRLQGPPVGGVGNGSAGWMESVGGPPRWVRQPLARDVKAGDAVVLEAEASGPGPIFYQWLRNGVPLTEGPRIRGVTTTHLTLTNVLGDLSGTYSLIASNSYGVRTSALAAIRVLDPWILRQPQPTNGLLGGEVSFTVEIRGSAATYQWYKDGQPLAGQTNAILRIGGLSTADIGFYHVWVATAYGSTQSLPALLSVNAALLDTRVTWQPVGQVHALAALRDGSWLVGGESLDQDVANRFVVRITPTGSPDPAFSPPLQHPVRSLAVMPNGDVVAGYEIPEILWEPALWLIDPTGQAVSPYRQDLIGTAFCLWPMSDGSLWVAGAVRILGDNTRAGLFKLRPDRSVADQPAFLFGGGDATVIARESSGTFLVGGSFQSVGGQARSGLARLQPDGRLVSDFAPSIPSTVRAIWAERDGKLLVGLATAPYLLRLESNGVPDLGFDVAPDGPVNAVVRDATGSYWLAGGFQTVNGIPRRGLARVRPDGWVDPQVCPQLDGPASGLALGEDGTVWVAGSFTAVDGLPARNLVRFTVSEQVTNRLRIEGGIPVWERSGPVPDLADVVFESSLDGRTWTQFARGVPDTRGWRADAARPTSVYLRARGLAREGSNSGCGSWRDVYWGPPLVFSLPWTETADYGRTVQLHAPVGGSEPLSFQWFQDGIPLSDNQRISGTDGPTLTLHGVGGADSGEYSVRVSNVYGSTTGVVAILQVREPVLLSLPSNTVVRLGDPLELRVEAAGTAPLTYLWFKDGAAIAGATNAVLRVMATTPDTAGEYHVLVQSPYGATMGGPIHVETISRHVTPLGAIRGRPRVNFALPLQGGGLVVGGLFTNTAPYLTNLMFLDTQGRVESDSRFNPRGADLVDPVRAAAVAPDQSLLIGGSFFNISNVSRSYLVRILPDRSLDASFQGRPDQYVSSLAVEADGAVLMAGGFFAVNSTTRRGLARLFPNGQLDPSFPGLGSVTYPPKLLPAGPDLYVGGGFSVPTNVGRGHLVRLGTNGLLDVSFEPAMQGIVLSLARDAQGRLLVAYHPLTGFTNSLVRLWPDGTLDTNFQAVLQGPVHAIAVQADGRIVVGGGFTNVNGLDRRYLARLFPDGRLDPSFHSGADAPVLSLALRPDGTLFVGGMFTNIMGAPASGLARLDPWEPARTSWRWDDGQLLWKTHPEGAEPVEVYFEVSTNQIDWARLGAAARSADGWTVPLDAISPGAKFRVLARCRGGYENGSEWWEIEEAGAPRVEGDLETIRARANDSVVIRAWLTGIEPMQYRWLINGVPLPDNDPRFRFEGTVLTILNARKPDSGIYALVASNILGQSTTAVAQVLIEDPYIASQPDSVDVVPGQVVRLEVEAGGTGPVAFQWFKDGLPVAGATQPSLDLSGGTDVRGFYSLSVSNQYGTIVSRPIVVSSGTVEPDPAFQSTTYRPSLMTRGLATVVALDGTLWAAIQAGPFWRTNLPVERLAPNGRMLVPQPFEGTTGSAGSLLFDLDDRLLVVGSVVGNGFTSSIVRLDHTGRVENMTLQATPFFPSEALWIGRDGSMYVARGAQNLVLRLRPDLTWDTNYTSPRSLLPGVQSVLEDQSGWLLVAGAFLAVGWGQCPGDTWLACCPTVEWTTGVCTGTIRTASGRRSSSPTAGSSSEESTAGLRDKTSVIWRDCCRMVRSIQNSVRLSAARFTAWLCKRMDGSGFPDPSPT